MNALIDRIRNEPALLSGLIVALLSLLAAFGLDLTAEQTAAITAVTGAGLALFVRSRVTPIRKPGVDASGWRGGTAGTDDAGAGELKLIALVALGVIVAVVFVIPLLERTF